MVEEVSRRGFFDFAKTGEGAIGSGALLLPHIGHHSSLEILSALQPEEEDARGQAVRLIGQPVFPRGELGVTERGNLLPKSIEDLELHPALPARAERNRRLAVEWVGVIRAQFEVSCIKGSP